MRQSASGAPGAPEFEAMGWPICGICEKQVDRVQYSYRERAGKGEHVFVARCHGSRETAIVTETDLLLATALDAFRFTTAFNARRTACG